MTEQGTFCQLCQTSRKRLLDHTGIKEQEFKTHQVMAYKPPVLSHAALWEGVSDDPLAETSFQAQEAPKVEEKSLIRTHRHASNNVRLLQQRRRGP